MVGAFLIPEEDITMAERAIPFAFGAIFTLIGAGLYIFHRRTERRQRAARRSLARHPEAPWKARKEWRSNEIASDARLNWLLVAFTVGLNAVHWPGLFFFLFGSDPNRFTSEAILYSLIVTPICLGLLAWLYVELRRYQKFGRSVLRLEEMPGRLGSRLRGVIQTGIPANPASQTSVRIVLRCIRQTVTIRRVADGDQEKDIDRDLLWQNDRRVMGRSAPDGSTLEIPFEFLIPADRPPSTPEKKDARVIWEVEVAARLPGVDFVSTFEIPVFPGSAQPSMPSDAEALPETRGTSPVAGAEQTAFDPSLAPRAPTESEAESGAKAECEAKAEEATASARSIHREPSPTSAYWTYDRPVSPGIELDDGSPFALHFKASRQRMNALITGGSGVVIMSLGVALFWGNMLLVLVGVLCVGIGGFLVYGSLQQAMNDTVLTIDEGTVSLTHDGLGMPSDVSFPASLLENVTIESESTYNQTSYALTLRVSDDARFHSLKAQKARVDAVLSTMGVPKSHAARQQLRAGALQPRMRVAGGIEHRGEAEWLARKIREAARHEGAFD